MKKYIFLFLALNFLISQDLIISEYVEGSSNNKAIEIYNLTDNTVSLDGYEIWRISNGGDWAEGESNAISLSGYTLESSDVFVVCNSSISEEYIAPCDIIGTTATYYNGNDAIGLAYNGVLIDALGEAGDNVGTAWDVAGVTHGMLDHTLVRKLDILSGNTDWASSAGTNADNSEWIVLPQNTFDYVGYHPHDIDGGVSDDGGGSDGGSGSEDCSNGVDDDGDSFIDCDDFDCDGDPICPDEICDDGIDNDDDTYIDCDDFDCSGDEACGGGGSGSCAEYGCVEFTPANACQCNNLCVEYNNCCDDYEELCAGSDDGGTTDGGSTDGGSTDGGGELIDEDNIFFSEYAEGSSNNKYLEIYNNDDHDVDLGEYSVSTCANGCDDGNTWDYPSNIEFTIGTLLSPGEVYVVCNGSADATILGQCDQYFTYLSNGDDVMGLTQVSTGGILDIIGTIGSDPGNGWDVAGVNDGTKDHTLVRKMDVFSGNFGNWDNSAGTNADDSEWIVLNQNTWDYLGSHPHDIDGGVSDDGGGSDGGSGSEDCSNGVDDDGDSYIDCDDFDCDGDPICPDEICDDGIDNDDDTYVDCNDFDCSGDDACGGDGTGSCAEYGCVGFTPANACQCNDLCVEYNNCCDDYEELCAGSDDGGTSDGGSTDGGGELIDEDNLFFSEYAEGSSNNKYLEIYNGDDHDVDLGDYSVSTCANGCDDDTWDYPSNVEFSSNTILSPGEVYVVCNGSADPTILGQCDQYFTYLSNGDDVMGLTQVSTGGILDIIGTIGPDPGSGWSVAGVSNATKDHTLVRKSSIPSGNLGDWSSSAGTNADNSEWEVYDQNTWDFLGFHDQGCNSVYGCTDEEAYNFDPCAEIDDNSCQYPVEVSIYQIQGQTDNSIYVDYPVITSGVVTGVTSNGFYIQDGGLWSGIWVYAQGIEGFELVEIADLVEVSGVVTEFYGLTEIEADGITIQNSNQNLPEPITISTGDLGESHEGVLVQFIAANCLTESNDYGEFEVNDGSGVALIDDKLLNFDPYINQDYDIIGIGDYGFDVYRLQATDISNSIPEGFPIAVATACLEDDFGEIDCELDEPFNYGDTVVLSGLDSEDSDDGQIIGYTWTQIEGISVSLSNYESVTTSFVAPMQFSFLTFALEVVDNNGNTTTTYLTVQIGEQTIFDVQYTADSGEGEDCYPSTSTGEIVNVTGIVTAVKSFSSYPNFFIQDPDEDEWGGIYVYVGESDPLALGDEVNFDAEVEEYYGVTELKNVSSMTILNTNVNINPVSISTGALGLECGPGEAYEGMYIEFPSVVVEEVVEFTSSSGSIDISYIINDGSGNAKINDYFFNFDAGSWPTYMAGDVIESVRGVVHYYFGQYVVYPRDLNDLSGSGGGDAVPTSIYDIQYTTNSGSGEEDCYPTLLSGQNVNVTGIVTAVKSFTSNPHFFVQDPQGSEWSGVYVYVGESDPLTVGDEISFDAEVDEYYGVTELKNVSSMSILNTNVNIDPVPISTGSLGTECGDGEMYEGMYINFSNAVVESVDSQYSSYYINDGSGVAKLDDYFFDFDAGSWPDLLAGDTIESVRGVVHYYFGEYVVYPRDLNDFTDSEVPCVATGDVNFDGIINVLDIVNSVSYILGTGTFNDNQLCAGDMNGDLIVNVIDIVLIVNIIFGT